MRPAQTPRMVRGSISRCVVFCVISAKENEPTGRSLRTIREQVEPTPFRKGDEAVILLVYV